MVMRLDTNQYNTKPAGNQRKKTITINGMKFITFCCIGSATGVGDIFCNKYMEAPIKIGKM